jgi:hypothetical protein
MSIYPIMGINTQLEINLDDRLPEDPLNFAILVSKAGLFVQYFMKDGSLWAKVIGPFDTIHDFRSQI